MEGNEVSGSRWSTAIQMKILSGENPFVNGVLQGIHDDLEDTVKNDEGTAWPEIYSFLLADIAMSLRKMADKGLDVDIVDLVQVWTLYDDTKKGGRGNAS